MIASISQRTLSVVLPIITIIWLLSAYISFSNTKNEVSVFFDAQLRQSGNVLLAISMHELIEQRLLSETSNPTTEIADKSLWQKDGLYENQIAFQIWLHNKTLTLRSENAPITRMSPAKTGFDTVMLFNRPWRVYTASTEDEIISVKVAMQITAQEKVASTVVERVVAPLFFLLPAIAFFFVVWREQKFKPAQTSLA